MAASQLATMLKGGELQAGCFARLNKFVLNTIQNKSIVILLDVAVVGAPTGLVGAPTSYPDGAPLPSATAAALGGPAAPAPARAFAPQHNARPAPAAAPKPPSNFGAAMRGAAAPGGGGAFRSISELNPYQQRFTIKARVTAKGPMRTWNKPTSSGNLFSVDLLDGSGEIRGTFFKEVADKVFPLLEEGKVYVFQETSGRLKPSNKQYTSIPHEFEVTFGNVTVEPADDDGAIARIVGDWKKISMFADGGGPREGNVDIVGVIKAAFPAGQITSKRTGQELTKREVVLCDDSGYDVRLTFWGELALRDDAFFEAQPVLAAKGLRVSDFGGVSLSSGFGSQLIFDGQEDPESLRLRAWWTEGGGREAPTVALTGASGGSGAPAAFGDRIVLDDIKGRQLGFGEKPDYVTFKGTLNFVKTDKLWYEACAQEGCQKKVVQNSDGTWHCEKCQATNAECKRRYLMSSTFVDDSAQSWVSAFNDHATKIFLGVNADDLAAYKEEVENEDGKFEDYMKQFLFKQYVVKVRVKSEVWQEQSRVKASIVDIFDLDYVAESRDILAALAVMG